MSHAAALDRLLALGGELATAPGQPRRKFDLAHMRILLDALSNPHLRFSSVLIAGTNGKGSTAATLASILAAAGYSTGLYTSPHLSRINERIRISSAPALLDPAEAALAPIPDAALYAYLAQVEQASARLVSIAALPATPSFFETLTAIAMLAFAGADAPAAKLIGTPVDIAILEVGMGGRLDATNVVHPLLSVITDISLDHTEWLGPTISAIAREKAGILRPGGTLVTLPQHPEANQALGEVALSLDVRGINAAEYLPGRAASSSTENRYTVQLDGQSIEVDSPLRGQHQQRNLALAIAAAVELRNSNDYIISNASIAAGISNTDWPGRLELIEASGLSLLLDVAHNPAGAWALRAALSQIDTPGPRLLLFGCMRDKAVAEIAHILFPVFDHVWLLELPSPRTASAGELAAAAERTGASYSVVPTPAAALEAARHYVTPIGTNPGLIVASGSVLLVGALRDLLS
jgi:dihydrofolate synthase/folylpolyglutamate synthase